MGPLLLLFSGGPNPAAIRTSPDVDVRTALVRQGAAFESDWLDLTFTVTGNGIAQIVNIRPVFYFKGERQLAWVYEPEGGCGGTYGRVFSLDLGNRTMKDLGVMGSPYMLPPGSAKPPASVIGESFHVSSSDPASIIVNAYSCTADYYEWGLQVTYIIGAREYSTFAGSPGDPFRLTGRPAYVIPAYTEAPPDYTQLMRAGVDNHTACTT